jgi:hypothetical protein
MKYLASLLFVISIMNSCLYGQDTNSKVKLELGLRDEFIYLNSNTKRSGYFLPLNFHLSAGIRLFEKYKLDYRIGIMLIQDDFLGIDRGLFFQADLFNTGFYAVLGIDFMNNNAEKGGEMTYWEFHPETTFYCFGLGCNINKHFNFDLMYYTPKNKVYSYTIDKFYNNQRSEKVEYGCIVLAFQYSLFFNLLND